MYKGGGGVQALRMYKFSKKIFYTLLCFFQCFDAATFLQMNERKPTWNCPVCDKKALYDDLLIDGYFMEVLEAKETQNEEVIMLERDGSWKLAPKEEEDKDKGKASSGASTGKSSHTQYQTTYVSKGKILEFIC